MDNLSRITPISRNASLSVAHYSAAAEFTVEDKLEVLEALQQSLDLKTLMRNFATQAARYVRFIGLRFQSKHGFFSLDFRKSADYVDNFSLDSADYTPLGTLSYRTAKPLTNRENALLSELHKLLSQPLLHSLKMSELQANCLKDHLTGIGNRAYFDETMDRWIEQNYRSHTGLALLLLDLDNFKEVNDRFGHQEGDAVLVRFSHLIKSAIRNSDMAFRLGGDEFAIVLTPTTEVSITQVSQRIKQALIQDPYMSELKIGCSMGWQDWSRGLDARELFQQADLSLYEHKARPNK